MEFRGKYKKLSEIKTREVTQRHSKNKLERSLKFIRVTWVFKKWAGSSTNKIFST